MLQIARFLPRHPWGRMGQRGYKGDDPRYINYNKQHGFRVSSRSHSDVFDPEKLAFFGPLIVEKVIKGEE